MPSDHTLTNEELTPDAADPLATFLNRLSSALQVIRDFPTLKETVGEIVGEYFRLGGVVWAQLDPAPVPSDEFAFAAPQATTLARRLPEYFDEQARAQLTAGFPVVVQDVATDTRVVCAEASLRRSGVGAFVVVPLASNAGKVLFCVYTAAARIWRERELAALRDVADVISPVLDRIRTQHALTLREDRLKLATQSTGVGIFDYDVIADRSYWSPEMCDIRGVPVGTEPRMSELIATVHEDDRDRFRAGIAAAFDPTGPGLFADELRLYRWDTGEVRWVTNSGQAFFEGAGSDRRVVRIVGIVRDITDRKIREAHDQFLSELADAWIRARDVRTLLQVTADRIRRHLDVTHISFIDVAPGASTGVDGVLNDAACGALASGWCVAVHDVAADARTASSRERLLANRIAALIDVPFRDDTGLTSVMRVASSTPREWRIEDLKMLEQLASRFPPALDRARAEEALRESEARQAFVLRFNDALRPLSDPDAMQQLASTMLCEHLQAYRVSFSDIEDGDVIVRQYSGAAPLPARAHLSLYPKALLEATARGELVAVADIRTDPRLTEAERTALLTRDYLSFVGIVRLDHGRKVAAVAVRSDTPRTWTCAETDLIRLIAERTWDAVERVRAQTALRTSEERLRLATANAGIGIVDYDVARDLANWSPKLCALLGVPENHSPRLADALLLCHPDDREYFETALTRSFDPRGSGVLKAEFRVCRPDNGDTRWLSVNCQTLFQGEGSDRRPVRTIGAVRDITHRKNQEARDQFLLELNDALRSLSDASQVQSTAARLLGQHLRVNRVGYAEVTDGRYAIRHEYSDGVAPNVGHGAIGTHGAALSSAYQRGEPVVVNDVQTDPRFTDAERAGLRAREIAAFIGVTLIKDGKLVAAFGANHSTARPWTSAEVDLVRVVAERTWEAAERARIEEALRASEHKLRLSLQAGRLGVWRYDLHTRDFEGDALGKQLHGLAPESAIGGLKEAISYLHPDDVEENQRRFARTLSEGVPFAHEYRVLLPGGETRWIASLGMVQADTSCMYGVVQDVTARKHAELALQEHDREQANTLRLLLETAGQAIILFDGDGTIVTANRACGTIFGWSEGELLGKSIEELLPPLLLDGRTGMVGRKRDGTTFPVEISLNHVATRDGARAMAFVTDISVRQQAEQTLQERSAQLERQAVQLRRLASDLTLAEQRAREQLAKTLHDGLQQLLFAVSLKLTQLEKATAGGTSVPPSLITETRVDLEEAINAARSLSLDLFPAGLIAARLSAAVKWLATWVRTKYGLFVDVSADARVEIERKDVRTLLLESLRELLLNVVKHADVDAVSVDLARDDAGTLIITVADEGKGFDATGLFDTGGSTPGGLGIFSIRERLALLGGRLAIESAAGRGTSCRLIIPAEAARDMRAAEPTGVPIPARPASPGTVVEKAGHRLRVLVVDDHPATLKAIRQLLASLPALEIIGEAGNGIEAIGLARVLRPDVIIMDISMPEMNGVEATRRIHLELPEVHIVGLSSYEKGDDPHPIEEVGASGYFRKGVDNQQLIQHLVEVHAGAASSLENA